MMIYPISRDPLTVVMICLKDGKSLRPNEVYLFVSLFEKLTNCVLSKGTKSDSKAPKVFLLTYFPKQEK